MPENSDDADVTSAEVPAAPGPTAPAETWEHHALFDAVKRALFALPSLFESELIISGVLATDLHTLNTSLGATLEVQVVEGLNRIRSVWDPDEDYALYRFVRQPQTFPDVTLRASAPDIEPKVILGIELKGWYALAAEGEPTFRFKVTPAVCQPQDLLVVYPWALQNVVSGKPRLFEPFVVSARYAAGYRNWYWVYVREAQGDRGITLSSVTTAYPSKAEPIADRADHDNSNFGRIARYGLMDEYLKVLRAQLLAGISIEAWQRFLSLFSERADDESVLARLARMQTEVARQRAGSTEAIFAQVEPHLAAIADLISGE